MSGQAVGNLCLPQRVADDGVAAVDGDVAVVAGLLDEGESRRALRAALACPPCVPIAVCGERLDRDVIERLKYYGVGSCEVVIERTRP